MDRKALNITILALLIFSYGSVLSQNSSDSSRIIISIGSGTMLNTCSLKKDYNNTGLYLPQKEFEVCVAPSVGLTYFTTKKYAIDLLSSYAFFRKFAFDSVINNEYSNYVSHSRFINFIISPRIGIVSFGNGFAPNYISLTGSAGLSLINHRYFNTEGTLFEKRNESRFMYSVGFELVHNGLEQLRIEYLSVGKNKFIQLVGIFPIITLFKIA